VIGEIEGVLEGTLFPDRQALHDAGVHRGVQQGIGGGGESIVLSGGYVDDRDEGDIILYTGQGGRDPATGRRIKDQELARGNLALANHYREGDPIRVCRGYQLDSSYAPDRGYRYDGLYRIDSFWSERGIDGYLVWRFRLIRITETERVEAQPPVGAQPGGTDSAPRRTVYTTRVIRSSQVGNYVKALYGHRCQISGELLDTPVGPYAEACHIRPVGRPHEGADVVGNVLCLSPNMHVLFDLGAIGIADDLTILGREGRLTLHPSHEILLDAIRYHREHVYRGDS
jgi:putative restriction endonuclease